LLAGAVHLTAACPFPGVAVAAVGMPGAPIVVVPPAADAGPDPFTLNAATLNVRVVPFVRPVTTSLVAALLNPRPTIGDRCHAVFVQVLGVHRFSSVGA
jgi:hypothetical protein